MKFKNISIKNKLTVMVLIITTIAIASGFTVVIIKDTQTFKNEIVNNTLMNAKLIGEYSIVPLTFNDKNSGKIILEKLEAMPYILNGYIFDKNGEIFAQFDKDEEHLGVSPSLFKNYKFEKKYLHVSQPIIFEGQVYGTIYIRTSTALVDEKIKHNIFTMIVLMLGLILLSYLLAFRFQRIISDPILKLATITEKISDAADYSLRVQKDGGDEIGILYDGFNNMLEQIHLREIERDVAENALRESENKYRSYVDNAPDGIFIADENGKYLAVNPAACKMTGYTEEELLQMHIPDILLPESIESGAKHFEKVITHGQASGELAYHKKDKTKAYWSVDGIKLSENRFLGFTRDITQRKIAQQELVKYRDHLEELVSFRTAELEAANDELKSFAYIVSHDLKAPLRGINNLATWLISDYGQVLEGEGKEMLELLMGRIRRLENLINGILAYSRAGRGDRKQEKIDLNSLIALMIDTLAPPENIRIQIKAELPTIIGDKTQIEQIFQNLIGNAVKFMDKSQGIIELDCYDEGKYWKFSIKDNGPGIDKKYHQKIFQIFQTLQARDVLESTGIGLSLVKKIIELYDGQIWLESEAGKGSIFYFTLTKEEFNDHEK